MSALKFVSIDCNYWKTTNFSPVFARPQNVNPLIPAHLTAPDDMHFLFASSAQSIYPDAVLGVLHYPFDPFGHLVQKRFIQKAFENTVLHPATKINVTCRLV